MSQHNAVEFRSLAFMGFPSYRVGSDGSFGKYIQGRGSWRRRLGHVLRSRGSKYGYVQVFLRENGKTLRAYLQCLVLEAFVGPRPDGMEASHLDGNSLNNCLTNLAWETPLVNNSRKQEHRTHQRTFRRMRESEVREARQLVADGWLVEDIAERYGLTLFRARRLVNGKSYAFVE